MSNATFRTSAWASCVALSLWAMPAFADIGTERVGVATAVNASTEGQPPGGERRPLVVGVDIASGEQIDTDLSGQAQLLFLDGSSITIGNRASVVIDDFVFNPESRQGQLSMALGRGLMRFVGGFLSKTGSVSVRTPTALLGIRGAIVLIEVAPDSGRTTATLLFGDHVTITGLFGATEVIKRIGESSSIGASGIPSPPRRIKSHELKPFNQALETQTATTVAMTSGSTKTPSPVGSADPDANAGVANSAQLQTLAGKMQSVIGSADLDATAGAANSAQLQTLAGKMESVIGSADLDATTGATNSAQLQTVAGKMESVVASAGVTGSAGVASPAQLATLAEKIEASLPSLDNRANPAVPGVMPLAKSMIDAAVAQTLAPTASASGPNPTDLRLAVQNVLSKSHLVATGQPSGSIPGLSAGLGKPPVMRPSPLPSPPGP